MDIQEAIKTLTARMGRYHPSDKITEATRTAISTLQEQAAREKGCKYCDGEYDISTISVARHTSDSETITQIETLYCPHCGRRLK